MTRTNTAKVIELRQREPDHLVGGSSSAEPFDQLPGTYARPAGDSPRGLR